jgi:hypothetical protein
MNGTRSSSLSQFNACLGLFAKWKSAQGTIESIRNWSFKAFQGVGYQNDTMILASYRFSMPPVRLMSCMTLLTPQLSGMWKWKF